MKKEATGAGAVMGVQAGRPEEPDDRERIKEMVRLLVREIIRKSPNGGYDLYAPHKKGEPKKFVANFPSRLSAKRAELARFPPKSPEAMARKQRELDRMKQGSNESVVKERIREHILQRLTEALFKEEKPASEWDQVISSIPEEALKKDPKLQKLQQAVAQQTEAVLQAAFKVARKALSGRKVKGPSKIERDPGTGKSYLTFSVTVGNVSVGPIHLYAEKDGSPRIEFSPEAQAELTKADPSEARLMRADLIDAQERGMQKLTGIADAVARRDEYLSKARNQVDSFLSGMTPIQLTLLKQLLGKKYRGMLPRESRVKR